MHFLIDIPFDKVPFTEMNSIIQVVFKFKLTLSGVPVSLVSAQATYTLFPDAATSGFVEFRLLTLKLIGSPKDLALSLLDLKNMSSPSPFAPLVSDQTTYTLFPKLQPQDS